MFGVFRLIARAIYLIASLPFRLINFAVGRVFLNLRWRWLSYTLNAAIGFAALSLILTYPAAFLLGWLDPGNFKPVFTYADQRARGTAIYDASDRFVGIIDPNLDSVYDLNLTAAPVVTPAYIAYPDHKSLHVDEAPPAFWACLKYHEDRYLGTWRNPFGIDLLGLFRMPYSTVERSVASRSLRFGAGGSTLSMQLVRSFLKQLPSSSETKLDKIKRKLREWWLAPILHHKLVYGDGEEEFARWAANHLPIAQRVGGAALFGVELASRVIFDKAAADLSRAQQYVLAAAVNRPIEVLPHSDRSRERLRLERWRKLVNSRAAVCANAAITAADEREQILAELEVLGRTAPEPKIDPEVVRTLEAQAVAPTGRSVNPVRRANNLLGALQYGLRQELVERHGLAWRNAVGSVNLTFDVLANRSFVKRIDTRLSELIASPVYRRKNADLSFDIADAEKSDKIVPRIVLAAADGDGRLVRYYENYANAIYYGSRSAWDDATGEYDPAAETMQLASAGKILAAIALANEGRDTAQTLYRDRCISTQGVQSCRRNCVAPHPTLRQRTAQVVFACSLSRPLIERLTRFQDRALFDLVAKLGVSTANLGSTPIETAVSNGLVAASPRTLHQVQHAILDVLDGSERSAIRPPTLIARTGRHGGIDTQPARAAVPVIAADTIDDKAAGYLSAVLSEPLCHPNGTLRGLRTDWCARNKSTVTLHAAKTGTRSFRLPAGRPDTMDLWISGQIHFNSGRKYTYVVYVGTGDPRKLMGRFAAGAQAGPLLRVLLEDLARDAAGS